ncbi:MAG TPA: sulfatase-like hydrolase/transferase, partial [Chitinophaga sp.]
DVYTSVMYMDDCLRGFFQAFAQRPDYQHTIFLITGDHRLPEIPMRSKIDRYHSPIIIYSPLLTRSATFSAISSHFDISPSLLAYLRAYPGFSAPQQVTWVGSGLDTARNFRNLHHYPLMQTKNDLVDYVEGTWMVNSGNLFKILPNMDLEPMQNDTMQKRLMSGFNYYLDKNDKMVQRKQLIPDSLYKAYTK